MSHTSEMLTIPEAATALGVSAPTVRRMIREGLLAATKPRGSWRIPRETVESLRTAAYREAISRMGGGA